MRTSIAVFIAVLATNAIATDPAGKYTIHNGTSCGTYIEERRNTRGVPYAQTLWWVSGYVTAYNAWVPDTYNIVGASDLDSVMLWLENWCKANALSNIAQALDHLVDELKPRRHRTARDAGR